MISKNTIKRLNRLSLKKNRIKEGLFLVEGDKMIKELALSDYNITELFVTPELEDFVSDRRFQNTTVQIVSSDELRKISQLKTPQNSLAVCKIPAELPLPDCLEDSLSVYLDSIQDPGNLGTIIRICDWFGVRNLFVSPSTVDLYNPKVIQASMGSYSRVRVWESSFDAIQKLAIKSDATIYGAFMEGENVYKQSLDEKAILVMGNEGNGVSAEIESQVDKKLSIPNFSENESKAESLNVSVATAILCSEFKRS